MNEHIQVFCLGGLDEVGRNLLCIKINEEIFVIEAGVKYPSKLTPGIDYIISDFSYLKDNKDKIKGYIITHGHDEVLGALAYMLKECPAPIYCSDVTKLFIESFVNHVNSKVKLNFNIVKPSDDIKIGSVNVSLFSTCHCMPHSFGVCLKTSFGNIIYSGDFIIENNSFQNFKHDINKISKLSEENTLLLITESSFSVHEGYTSPKHRLTPTIEQTFKNTNDGKIIVSTFSTNAFAIAEIIKLAKVNRKKVCPFDNETKEILSNLSIIEECKVNDEDLVDINEIKRYRDDSLVILILGFNDKLYRKINNFSQRKTNIDINSNDTFIAAFSASSRFEIEHARMLDNLYRANLKVIMVNKKNYIGMHPSQEDLKTFISIFNPKYYLPVKGNYINLYNNAMYAFGVSKNLNYNTIFLLDNGEVLDFNNGIAKKLPSSNNILTGELLTDGLSVTSSVTSLCNTRIKLGQDGLIIIDLVVDVNKKIIVSDISVNLIGITYYKDHDNLINSIKAYVTETIKKQFLTNFNIVNAETKIKEAITYNVRRETNKEPLIKPIILIKE